MSLFLHVVLVQYQSSLTQLSLNKNSHAIQFKTSLMHVT